MASTIDPTVNGDMTADGRSVTKANLQAELQAAVDDIEALQDSRVRALQDIVTLAELNAGKTILSIASGNRITVVGVLFRFTGTFATGTSMELEDTNGTPVVVASVAQADMAAGDKWDQGNTEVVLTEFGTQLTVSAGLAVTATGAAFTGGTSVTVDVLYKVGA